MQSAAYARYVALGDSQTEGIGDEDGTGGYRGWADRLAEKLAVYNPCLTYANLAVRGRTAAQIHAEQLEPALRLRPDLATVVVGMNDLIRRGFDPAVIAGHLAEMSAALAGAGARVVTVTFPDISKSSPLARPLLPRILELNERIRAVAADCDAIVVDLFRHPVTTDPRLWSRDRLHCSPQGHARLADAVAHALEVPGSDETWTLPLSPLAPAGPLGAATAEFRWLVDTLAPSVIRRFRNAPSGSARAAKRPSLKPVLENSSATDHSL